MSLKTLDSTIRGLRVGLAKRMDGETLAPVFRFGSFAIGRRVVGELSRFSSSVTIESHKGFDLDTGRSAELRADGRVVVTRWSADTLGYGSNVERTLPVSEVNKDSKLKHHLYFQERK